MSSRFLAAIGSGFFLALPFLFPVLFSLAWISFVPLFWAVQKRGNPSQAFFFGWLAGAIANLSGFYWLDYTIRVFGGFPYGLSELIFAAFAAYSGFPIAFFSLLVRLFGLGPLSLFPAFFWVAIEFWFPLLFPWHLANSQSQFLSFIQSADLVGPYGTSFLLVWLNSTIYAAISSGRGNSRVLIRDGAVLSLFLIGVFFYGHVRLKGFDTGLRGGASIPIAAIQGSIDIRFKWSVAYLENNLKSYQDLTDKAQGTTLVIWPESAVEAWLPENITQLPSEILPKLSTRTFFIFGARSYRGDPTMPNMKAFNSAFLTDSQGRISSYYHKQVLLAFGEYIPFGALLSRLPGLPALGDGFTPGNGPRTLDLPAGVKVAPLICYEDLMPSLARRFVAEKEANLLVNLTNDAWFGDTAAPWQHARLSQWRAIETRRYLVRVTNTGLTSVISPRGEIMENLPPFSPGVLKTEVKAMEGKTLYVRFGDWFAWLASLLALAIALWQALKKGSKSSTRSNR